MEKKKFVFHAKMTRDVYSKTSYIIERSMSNYSIDGRVKRYDFDEGKFASSIVSSGENLVKVKYFQYFGNVMMNFEIFGRNREELTEIKVGLKTGLENLL